MDETKPNKMVNTNVAVAPGIICVALMGSLAYFIVATGFGWIGDKSLGRDLDPRPPPYQGGAPPG